MMADVALLLMVFHVMAACLLPAAEAAGTVPTYVWPLGKGIFTAEVKTNYQSGNLSDVSFIEGAVGKGLDYDAFLFKGQSSSYVEIQIPNHVDLNVDFTFVFLVYLNDATTGTLFHMKSDDLGALYSVTEIELSLTAGGNVVLKMSGHGDISVSAAWETSSETLAVSLATGQWYTLGLEMDLNKNFMDLFVDGILYRTGNIFAKDTPIKLPAVIRIGTSQNGGTSWLDGRVTCLAAVPSRYVFTNVADLNVLLTECTTANWGAAATTGGCPSGCTEQDAKFAALPSSGSAPMALFTTVDSDDDTTAVECAAKCKASTVCMSFVFNKSTGACRLYDGDYSSFVDVSDSADRYYVRNDACCP